LAARPVVALVTAPLRQVQAPLPRLDGRGPVEVERLRLPPELLDRAPVLVVLAALDPVCWSSAKLWLAS
jgi:hypothetical protein